MALKPILENIICQKLVARKKLENKAMRLPYNSFAIKYNPSTVSIPMIALGNLSTHGSVPNAQTKRDWILIKNPSLPKFSG